MKPAYFSANRPYDELIVDDPVFNPAIHLCLEYPQDILTLADLGYNESLIQTPSSVAATSCVI